MAGENDKLSENSDQLMLFEVALRQLRPEPPRIERDRLMFLAGRASAESTQYSVLSTEYSSQAFELATARINHLRGNWFWPASTAALAATSLALAVALVLRGEPREVIVYRDAPGPAIAVAATPRGAAAEDFQVAAVVSIRPVVSRVPAENYLRTREVAARMGLDAIGSQPGGPDFSAPPTYGDLLLGLMGSRRDSERDGDRQENMSNM
jgi:hypothetical protein